MWKQLATLSRFLQPTKILTNPAAIRSFSIISNIINRNLAPPAVTANCQQLIPSLLQPSSILVNIDRGFKQKGRLRRRCKDCYMVMREERLYVICKTHPRHKQMAMIKKPKNTWLLTDATQSPQRAW